MSDQKMNLKPCPFCGCDAVFENLVLEAVIRCENCHAKIVRQHHRHVDTGVNEVIAAWQKRD